MATAILARLAVATLLAASSELAAAQSTPTIRIVDWGRELVIE